MKYYILKVSFTQSPHKNYWTLVTAEQVQEVYKFEYVDGMVKLVLTDNPAGRIEILPYNGNGEEKIAVDGITVGEKQYSVAP